MTVPAPRPSSAGSRIAQAAWWTALVLGLVATIAACTPVGPTRAWHTGTSGADAIAFATPSWLVAAVLLGSLATVPPPARHRRDAAMVGRLCAVIVGVLTTGFLAWRAIVRTKDARALSDEQASLAIVGLTVLIVLLAAVALRCHRALATPGVWRSRMRGLALTLRGAAPKGRRGRTRGDDRAAPPPPVGRDSRR